MEPGDRQDAPVSKILHFIWSVRLLKGWNRGGWGCMKTIEDCTARARLGLPLMHSFIQQSPYSLPYSMILWQHD
jgi:hypothetical protein